VTHLARTAERVRNFTWTYREEETELRSRLMAEFLRRSALWAKAFGAPMWPFPDLAAAVDPEVRAPEEVLKPVLATVPEFRPVVRTVLTNALHFAALQDAKTALPDLPDPYAPLLALLERGEGFGVDGIGRIEVDMQGLPRKNAGFWAEREPAGADRGARRGRGCALS
jgi:hypothetical protein